MPDGEEELTKEDENRLDSIDSTLKEILKWTRFANITKLKETLEAELDTDQKKIAYERSDGLNGLKEVAAACGAPLQTVKNWWPKWFRLGLVGESEIRKGRMKKIVSLDDMGIKIPKGGKTSQVSPVPQEQQTESEQDQNQSVQPSSTQEPNT